MGKAVVRGRITAAASGQPLHRARVTLGGGPAANAPTAVTDAEGRFEVTGVPAGSYSATAQRAGYLTIQFGQRRPREAGRTIEIKDGQVLERIDIALHRGAVLAGRITDELGEPVAGVRMEAMDVRYLRGRRMLLQAGIATSNDIGQFRISGMEPGTYYLKASTMDMWTGDGDKGETYAYAQTYYPGVIRGRITTADSGRPLRRARVTLLPVTPQVGQVRIAASTNSRGEYELTDVPAGTYRVSAARGSYITLEYGQRRTLEDGQPIEARAGRALDRIDIALPKGGVLSGRITDELGETFPGIRVETRQLRYVGGRQVFYSAGTTLTDDLGQFRVGGLQPGTYYLMASTREMWVGAERHTYGYAATYFPGGPLDQVQGIALAAAQERSNLDFRLAASRTARVSGVVQSATATPLEAQTVILTVEYRGAGLISSDAMTARTGPGGTFAFEQVAPGQYLLQSRSAGQAANGQDEVAALHIDVAGADLENLVLMRRYGTNVTGSVLSDEGTPPPFAPSILRASPVAADRDKMLPTPILMSLRQVKPDWSFAIPNIAGPFVFRLDGLPADWMIKSVRLEDRDITDTPIDVPTGGREIAGLQIVVTQKGGRVSGVVVDQSGNPDPDVTVVVFADDTDRWGLGTRFVKMARPTNDGQFSIAGLPEGAYRAIAMASIMDGQWEDREFLASVQNDAQRFELAEGAMRDMTLKVPARR